VRKFDYVITGCDREHETGPVFFGDSNKACITTLKTPAALRKQGESLTARLLAKRREKLLLTHRSLQNKNAGAAKLKAQMQTNCLRPSEVCRSPH
jgi:hypothetical protein